MAKRKTAPARVSLPALLSAHERLDKAERITRERRQERDALVRALIDSGHSVRSLANALGMARQSIMAIRDEGVEKPTHPESDPLF